MDKVDIYMKGISLATFDLFFTDMEKQMDMKHVTAFKVLEKNEDDTPALVYYRTKMTGMSEREMVMKFEKTVLEDGKYLYV